MCVRTCIMLSVFFPRLSWAVSTQSGHIPDTQQTTRAKIPSLQRCRHPYAQYCCGWLCLSGPAVRIPPFALPGTWYQILFHTSKYYHTHGLTDVPIVPSSSPLFLLLLLRLAVCDPMLPLLQLCSAQQCANSSSRQRTIRTWQIRAVLSVLHTVK